MTEFNPGGAASLNQAVKLRYETNPDTNAFTDAEKTKLAGVLDGATVNDSDAQLRDRATHTGMQAANTINDFDTAVASNAAVAANTAKVSNATHTGDVTGDTALTISDGAVTYSKIQDLSAPGLLLGRGGAASGPVEGITIGAGLSMTGTTLSASGGGGSSPKPQTVNVNGRWYCYTDKRWIGLSAVYGAAGGNFNQSAGSNAEPTKNWTIWGPTLQANAQIEGVKFLARGSNAEVGGVDLRIYLSRGPWDGSWGNSGVTIWDTIYSVDNVAFTSTNWIRHSATITPFNCADDGHMLVFVRPTGTLTTTRFLFGSLSVEYQKTV